MDSLGFAARALLDLFFPRRCIVCEKRLRVGENYLCLNCDLSLPLTYYWSLPYNPMADKFNLLVQERYVKVAQVYEPYIPACALYYYHQANGYSRITQRLKYSGEIRCGRFFASRLARRMSSGGGFRDVDFVIPVPLHPSRLRKRGYNQAEIIAQELARQLAARLETRVLLRCRKTVSQTTLSGEEKAANVEKAFALSADAEQRIMAAGSQRGPHILLVDDVFTTGATLFACFLALRSGLPSSVRISIATLAFVGDS